MIKLFSPVFVLFLFAIVGTANAQQVFDSTFTGVASSFQDVTQIGSGGAFSGSSLAFDDGLSPPGSPPFFIVEEFATVAVFDLANLSGPATSAYLELDLDPGGFNSDDSFEEFVIHDVSSSPDSILLSGVIDMFSFPDFVSGVQFGSTNVESGDEGSIVRLHLNADGVAVVNSSAGGLVAFAGSVSNLNVDPSVNNFSEGVSFSDVRLVVATSVPEPESGFAIGLMGLVLANFRRKRC